LKSVKTLPRYGNFSIFQDGGCRHVGFSFFEILTVGTLKTAKLRHCAEFRQNRSNYTVYKSCMLQGYGHEYLQQLPF